MTTYADEINGKNSSENTEVKEPEPCIVYVQTRLEIKAKDKDHLKEILDDMDYDFTFKEGDEELIKDTEIQEFTDCEGECIDESGVLPF